MTLRLSGLVDAQLVAAAKSITHDDTGAAGRFLDSVYAEFDFILQWPEASPQARMKSRRLRGVRYRPVRRPFQNYLVFYMILPGEVFVGAVLHGATNWTEDFEIF